MIYCTKCSLLAPYLPTSSRRGHFLLPLAMFALQYRRISHKQVAMHTQLAAVNATLFEPCLEAVQVPPLTMLFCGAGLAV